MRGITNNMYRNIQIRNTHGVKIFSYQHALRLTFHCQEEYDELSELI